MNRLHKYLPSYYRNSKVFEEITKVESDEFDKLDLDIEDLALQFVVDTATWGLAIYEKELQLPIRPNKTLDERRSIIKAKMRGIGKVDYIMIKAIVEAFTSSVATIEFNGKINIVFDDSNLIDVSNRDMFRSIDEVKPAHLDYEFESRIERIINIVTSVSRGFSLLPLCNTIEVGGWPYQQSVGKWNYSNLLTITENKEGPVPYRDTATIAASEKLYEEHLFATQATYKSIVKPILSYIEREVGYVEANKVVSGEYPYAVIEGKVIDTGSIIKASLSGGKSKYSEAATVTSSEELYEEYIFAEITDFEFGLTSKHHVSLRELEYKKPGNVVTGDYPYTKNLIKVQENRVTEKDDSKSGVSAYRICGETYTEEDAQ